MPQYAADAPHVAFDAFYRVAMPATAYALRQTCAAR